jgi:hypothetical protein
VPFELGRPLGAPNQPDFQHKVLLSALKLLEAPSGPVLKDFPEESPVSSSDKEIMIPACPVNFSSNRDQITETNKMIEAFKQEVSGMRSWYDMGVSKRGRTTFGASQLDINEIIHLICDLVNGETPDNPRDDISLPFTINYAVDDLKAFYLEGVTAQPGQDSHMSEALSDWFWNETIAGNVIKKLRTVCKNSQDGMMQIVGTILLVPAAQVHRKK